MPTVAEISPATRRAVARGVGCFDAGRFFDAHEVWEEAWHAETGEVRRALQGLIQIAAGFHKGLVQGRPSGMMKLLGTGLARIDAAGAAGLVPLEPFRSEVARWMEAARVWAAGGPRPDLPLPRLGGPAHRPRPG